MAEPKTTTQKETKTQTDKMIAVIRIRGETGIDKDVKDTLTMLNLHRKFHCVIVPKAKNFEGMIQKAKDFITFGEIDAETIKLLDEKRKEEGKKYYRLHPPRGGFERKGTKRTFTEGGVLGNRKEEINNLIKRMI